MRGSIGHVDDLIRFGGQKVKGQGHSGSNKGQNLTFLALNPTTYSSGSQTFLVATLNTALVRPGDPKCVNTQCYLSYLEMLCLSIFIYYVYGLVLLIKQK